MDNSYDLRLPVNKIGNTHIFNVGMHPSTHHEDSKWSWAQLSTLLQVYTSCMRGDVLAPYI